MEDLLLPRTDAGVAFQFILATAIFAYAILRYRRNKDARIFVIGLWILTYGLMGVRALH